MIDNRSATFARATVVPVVFFSFFLFFLWARVDPRIIYAINATASYSYRLELTSDFFTHSMAQPGGTATVFAAMIVCLCHSRFLGACILTLLAAIFFPMLRALVPRSENALRNWIPYLPVLLLFSLLVRYEAGFLTDIITVAGSVSGAILYRMFSNRSAVVRLALFSVLFWTIYFLFSWGAVLVVIIIATGETAAGWRRLTLALFAGALNAAVLYAVYSVFSNWMVLFDIQYLFCTENSGAVFRASMCALPPIVAIIAAVRRRIDRMMRSRPPRPSALPIGAKRGKLPGQAAIPGAKTVLLLPPGFLQTVAGCLLLGSAAAYISIFQFDHFRKDVGSNIRFIRTQQWEKLLAYDNSRFYRRAPVFALNAINHTLARTGRLGSSMFSFPQLPSAETLLMTNSIRQRNTLAWVMCIPLYSHLGMIGFAEKLAGEVMESQGADPWILRLRARAHLAKGMYEPARVYLTRLSTMPFFCSEARTLLETLKNDTLARDDAEIVHMRAVRDTLHTLMFQASDEQKLLNLLASNPHNALAFEYLMAYYLLNRQLPLFANNLRRLKDFSSNIIPRHYEEAICILEQTEYRALLDSISIPPISDPTRLRFAEFNRALGENSGLPDAQRLLRPRFGDTYYYFFLYGTSGKDPLHLRMEKQNENR